MSRFLQFFLQNPLVWLVFLLTTTAGVTNDVRGQENPPSFEKALGKPFRASLNGGSLRGTLDAVREATDVPYWLDRRVDPDQSLGPIAAGPNIEQAYMRIAHAADLATFPVDAVIVIGRVDWVDRVGAAWISQTDKARRPLAAPISVAWPALTTPREALQHAGLGDAAVDLPHDLWPALHVDAIRPAALLLLIGAQFDQWLERDEHDGWRVRPLPEDVSIVRRYPANSRSKTLRPAALQFDPDTKWNIEQQQIVVDASVRVHRMILNALRNDDAAFSPNKRRRNANRQQPLTSQVSFRFELKNAPAGGALATLANSAGWKLEITPPAQAACQQRISFEGETEATLEQWVQRVVEKVDLTAVREGDVLRIDVK